MVRVRFTMSGHVNGRPVSEVHYIECERYQLVGHQDITVDDDHICEWEEIESRIFIDSNDIERVDYVEVPARDEESILARAWTEAAVEMQQLNAAGGAAAPAPPAAPAEAAAPAETD